MRILVWQWGRRGAGPRFATELAAGLRLLPGVEAMLSLSAQAEILRGQDRPRCELEMPTYQGVGGLARRLALLPLSVGPLAARLRALRPDLAICAMPAPLDVLAAAALRRAEVPMVVVVHDADNHPGDGFPLQMMLQRRLARRADALVALSGHVADRLRQQGLAGGQTTRPLFTAFHPPLPFGPAPPPPGGHGGRARVLFFGRLLPYKGLDLLEAAWRGLGPQPDMELRVVGQGPESAALDALRRLPGVTVENRWVPEAEIAALLAWSDALVLSHREASQSGVAAVAIAAGRWLVASRVGGLAEQLRGERLAILCDPDGPSLTQGLHALARQMRMRPSGRTADLRLADTQFPDLRGPEPRMPESQGPGARGSEARGRDSRAIWGQVGTDLVRQIAAAGIIQFDLGDAEGEAADLAAPPVVSLRRRGPAGS